MDIPNIIGYEINKAIKVLTDWDKSIEIKKVETVSSKKSHQEIPLETRVVNQEFSEGGFTLTIAHF